MLALNQQWTVGLGITQDPCSYSRTWSHTHFSYPKKGSSATSPEKISLEYKEAGNGDTRFRTIVC